jgi:hypothetical protein
MNTISDYLKIAIFFILLAIVVFSGPIFGVDAEGATRVLTQQGYTEIHITGYRWFVGDRADFYHTGFSAKSPAKIDVTGTITKGLWFKSSTIRFD